MHPAATVSLKILGIAVLLAIPQHLLSDAWQQVATEAEADLQVVQATAVTSQAARLSGHFQLLHITAAYLAEEPDRLRSRLWSGALPQNGLNETIRVVLHGQQGDIELQSASGEPCNAVGLPSAPGLTVCTLPPLRVAVTESTGDGRMVTVLQESAAFSPLLEHPWAWMVDGTGAIVAHADPKQAGTAPFDRTVDDPRLTQMLTRMAAGESGLTRYNWTEDGVSEVRLAAFAPVVGGPRGWAIATSSPRAAATRRLAAARMQLGLVGWGIFGVFGFAGLLAIFLERKRHRRDVAHAQERLLMTQAAAHSERLALLGTLTAGVAHDIRGPLTALNAIADLMFDADDEERNELLDDMRDATSTMAAIANDLTGFARGDESASGSPTRAIDLAVRMVRSHFNGRRRLVIDLHELAQVPLDARRLSQAIMNICINAVQAGASNVRIVGRLQHDSVWITVEDDGPGVPDDLGQRIFEPFLTTKAEGKGTGLGLYLASQFLQAAGGSLSLVDSSIGGAGFRLVLPTIAPTTTVGEQAAAR